MNSKKFAIAAVLGTLLSANAFAASPAAGEGPLFTAEPVQASSVSREQVRQAAIATPPAAGAHSGVADVAVASTQSRAEVRAETAQALNQGFVVKSGEMS